MKTLILAVLAAGVAAAEQPAPGVVVTDADWRAVEGDVPGWSDAGLDDGDWGAAEVIPGPAGNGGHYSAENSLGVDSKAAWIWKGDGRQCVFRRRFAAPAGFRRAELLVVADDLGEVAINGAIVEVYDTQFGSWGHRGCAVLVDLLPWIQEGDNLLAVRVTNRGGPSGLCAELRVDGEPFVPPAPQGGALPAEVAAEARALAPALDADDAGEREKALARLVALARRHGRAVADEARTALGEPSPEAATRLDRVAEAALPDLSPTVEDDPRFGYGALSVEDLRARLTHANTHLALTLRSLMAARVLAHSDPEGLARLLAVTGQEGTEVEAQRVARLVAALDLPGQSDTLVEILRTRPGTGAYAAAALARTGGPEHIETLRQAARAGVVWTKRASESAIRILESRRER